MSSELRGTEKHCSFCSGKGELVKIKVRAGNLLALVNKDSVGILRVFLLDGAQLSGAKKLHSSWATSKLRFAEAALKAHLLRSRAHSESCFSQECARASGSVECDVRGKEAPETAVGMVGTGLSCSCICCSSSKADCPGLSSWLSVHGLRDPLQGSFSSSAAWGQLSSSPDKTCPKDYMRMYVNTNV